MQSNQSVNQFILQKLLIRQDLMKKMDFEISFPENDGRALKLAFGK